MELLQDSGFVIENRLELEFRNHPPTVVIRGRIQCLHGLFVDVEKTLAVQDQHGRLLVRTVEYAYHAGIEGDQDRAIFRYDNAHSYESHADAHHKHRYDHTTWRRIDPPDWVGEARWPHLSDVIDELQLWWDETGQYLGLDAGPGEQMTEADARSAETG